MALLMGDKFLSSPDIIFVLGQHGISHKWQAPYSTILGTSRKAVLLQKVFIKDFPEAGGPHFSFQISFQSQAVVEMSFSVSGKRCAIHVAVDSWRLMLNSPIPNLLAGGGKGQ